MTGTEAVLQRFIARGHPAIRASHAKTLEFTADPQIGERATCVVGVAAELPAVAVAGPIRLTLQVGDHCLECTAVGNSGWLPGSSAVIRRSDNRLPDTFATDADLVASRIPRELVQILRSVDTELTVTVRRAAGAAGGTLVRLRLAIGADPRLLPEATAADLVVAEDPVARARLVAAGLAPGRLAGGGTLLAAGGRLLAVSAMAPVGPGSLGQALAAAGAVEVLGFPAELAVSAAAAADSPTITVPSGSARTVAELAAANPAAALVLRCPADELAGLLSRLDRPEASVIVAPVENPERPVRTNLAGLAVSGRDELVCRVAGNPAAAGLPATDPARLVRELLAQSVTPRTIALALAALPGWSRRSAYQFVLSLSGGESAD